MFKKIKSKKSLAAIITLVALFAFSGVMTVIAAAQEASLVSERLSRIRKAMTRAKT